MKSNTRDAAGLARTLKLLVTAAFVCNLAALPLVPGMVFANAAVRGLLLRTLLSPDGLYYFLLAWVAVWPDPYTAVLTLFLLFCGGCTTIILWQARRVLATVIAGDTFTRPNAQNMGRAGVCCFLIGGAALLRVIWGFYYYRSAAPLLTYNALFVPLFVMGGLLCMVMSALFRQAAALKEESDLTI